MPSNTGGSDNGTTRASSADHQSQVSRIYTHKYVKKVTTNSLVQLTDKTETSTKAKLITAKNEQRIFQKAG